MGRLKLAVLALALAVSAPAASAQRAYVIWGRVLYQTRVVMAAHYQTLYRAPTAHEYGFCAKSFPDANDGNTPVVYQVRYPSTLKSGPNFAEFRCAKDEIPGHVHPPAACDPDPKSTGAIKSVLLNTCTFNTDWGNQCMPSPNDLNLAREQHDTLSIVQCDANAILFYAPIPIAARDTAPLTFAPVIVPPLKLAPPKNEARLSPDTVPDTIPVLPNVDVTAPRSAGAFPDSLFADTASLKTLRRFNFGLIKQEQALLKRLQAVQARSDSLNQTKPDGTTYVPPALQVPAPKATSWLRGLSYIGGSAVVGYAGGLVDRDHGGYKDDLIPRVDKLAHSSMSAICAREISDRIGMAWGWVSCVAMGAALEKGQSRNGGYASWGFDFPYDMFGTTSGMLWAKAHGAHWVRKVR